MQNKACCPLTALPGSRKKQRSQQHIITTATPIEIYKYLFIAVACTSQTTTLQPCKEVARECNCLRAHKHKHTQNKSQAKTTLQHSQNSQTKQTKHKQISGSAVPQFSCMTVRFETLKIENLKTCWALPSLNSHA